MNIIDTDGVTDMVNQRFELRIYAPFLEDCYMLYTGEIGSINTVPQEEGLYLPADIFFEGRLDKPLLCIRMANLLSEKKKVKIKKLKRRNHKRTSGLHSSLL